MTSDDNNNFDFSFEEINKSYDDFLGETSKYYVENVIGGFNLKTGSFIALNDDKKKFFANKSTVIKNSFLFDSLKEGNEYWIFVKDEIWSSFISKNKHVSKIYAIYKTKEECEEIKKNLIIEYELQIKLAVIFKIEIKLIEEMFTKSYTEKLEKLKIERIKIENYLNEINQKLN